MDSIKIVKDKVIGALSGLSKSCNMHGRTENTTAVILRALAMTHPSSDASGEQLEQMLAEIHEEKRKVAPDCAVCKVKCGNTDDLDLSLFEIDKPRIRELKRAIVAKLCEEGLAKAALYEDGKLSKAEEDYFYQALCAISYDMDAERYEKFL